MEPPKDEASDPSGKAYPTTGVTVWFDKTRCLHFAECVRGLNDVFQPGRKPWVQPELGDPEDPDSPTLIRHIRNGPLLLRGDLAIKTRTGVVRDTRAALCACGATTNAPFCDDTCKVNSPLEPRD